jgi:hypothetical protein
MLTRSHSARLFTALLSLPLFVACGQSDAGSVAQELDARRAAASAWLAACARPLAESASPSELQFAIEELKPKTAPSNQGDGEVFTRALEERTRRVDEALNRLAVLRSARQSLSDSLRWPAPDSDGAELDATAVRSWARKVEVGAERRRPADFARELREASAALAADAVQVEELRALEQQLSCVTPDSELDHKLTELGAALCSSAERTGVKLDVQARRCDASRLGLRDGWTLIAGAVGQAKTQAPGSAEPETGVGGRPVEAGTTLDIADALAPLANSNTPTFVAWGADRAPQGFEVLELRKPTANAFSQAHVRVAARTTEGELVVHGFARDWKDARPRYLLVPGHAAWLAVTIKVNTDAGTEEITRGELGEQSLAFADTDAALQRALERCDVASAKRFDEQLKTLAPNAAAQARGARELQSALQFESESRVLLERLTPCAAGADELLGQAERLLAGRGTSACTATLEARVREVKAAQSSTRELERLRDQVQSLKSKPAPRVSALWVVAQELQAARAAGATCEEHARTLEQLDGALIAELGRIQLAKLSLAECGAELEALALWREVSARPELAVHTQGLEDALAVQLRDEFAKASPGDLLELLSKRRAEAAKAGSALQKVVAECAIDVLARTAPGEAAKDLERLKWLAELDALTADQPELLEGALLTALNAQCSALSKVAGEKKTLAHTLQLWANWSKQEQPGSGGPVREMVWTEVVKPLWREIDKRLGQDVRPRLSELCVQRDAFSKFIGAFRPQSFVELVDESTAGTWANDQHQKVMAAIDAACEPLLDTLNELVAGGKCNEAQNLAAQIERDLGELDARVLHARIVSLECRALLSTGDWSSVLKPIDMLVGKIKKCEVEPDVGDRLLQEAHWVRCTATNKLVAKYLREYEKFYLDQAQGRDSTTPSASHEDFKNWHKQSKDSLSKLTGEEIVQPYGGRLRTYRKHDVRVSYEENELTWQRLFELYGEPRGK